jgi:hypothetical protein
MDLVYPIQAILLYLSLLFAPADAERITFNGPDHSGVLIRDASGWNLVGPEGNILVSIDGTRFVSGSKRESLTVDLLEYLPGLAGHDWEKQPKLTLPDASVPDATTIERTPDGFKLRNNRGTEGIYHYTIFYVRKNPAGGPTCNVLGAVKQPGVVLLQEGDTLRSILLKAGGPAGKITPPIVWLLRGKPGEPLSQREGFDLAGVLEGRTGNPQLRDRDTLYIEPTVLLELARDDSLAVDGQPCSDAELPARLRDRVEAGVRSATLRADRDTPQDRIQPLLDACIAAGIPAERLKLDSAKDPD